MRASRFTLLAIMLFAGRVTAVAQVVPAVEIRDPELRKLQQNELPQMKQVGQNIAALHFDYPFYFSRKLDVDERQQQRIDQHSIRFERFDGATVLAISGNYYGAYSSVKFNEELRARGVDTTLLFPPVTQEAEDANRHMLWPLALDLMRDCCAYSWDVRNCHWYDWGTFER